MRCVGGRLAMVMLALVGLTAAGLLFTWFTRLYRDGRAEVVFGVLVGVWLAEALLNSAAAAVDEGGIFRPVVAGQDFRPPDLVILVALAVQALQARRLGKFGWTAFTWGIFGLWYSTAGLYGLMRGNPTSEVLFHGKAVFYILGSAAIASRADLPAIVSSRAYERWRWIVGSVAASFVVGTLVGLQLQVNVPAVKINRFGTLSNDSLTIVVGVGLVFALTLAASNRRSPWLFVLTTLMIVAPVAANQRANFVGLAGSAGVIAIAVLGNAWRHRVRTTGTEVLVFLGAFVVLGVLGTFLGGSSTDIFARFDDTFFSGTEEQTTAVREETWRQASDMLKAQPLIGYGLGVEQTIGPIGRDVWQNAKAEAREITSHNLFFDLGLRSGLIGVTLFVMAIGSTVSGAVRVWRYHRDPVVGAFVLGLLALLAGVIAKGLVESVFEKFRLTVAIGLVVGIVISAQRSMHTDDLEVAGAARAVR